MAWWKIYKVVKITCVLKVSIVSLLVIVVQAPLQKHYDQSHQTLQSYNSYGGVGHHSGSGDADRTPLRTPSTSVHSSPGHHQGNTVI